MHTGLSVTQDSIKTFFIIYFFFKSGYRNGPNDDDAYGLSPQYWHVFAARLAFVVIFEVFLHQTIQTNPKSKNISLILAYSIRLNRNHAICDTRCAFRGIVSFF